MDEIEFQSVTKRFGPVEVLRGIDLGVERGAFCVILGPSGCGKSTLLRLFAGLERLSGGTVRLGGRVLNELAPKDRDVAMVFQNYALYPHMTVAQNLGYALKVAGVARAERDERVRAVAATLQLGTLLDRRPGELSGGQRQRVAMGRAIVRRPRVFLFDEPLSNLDAKLRTQMRLEIKRLHLKLGVTSLFVTHDQVEAMTLADRLVVMNGGAIEQIGSPADVYRAPSSAFVAGFLGTPAMNLLPASVAAGGLWAELDAGLRVPLAPGAAGLRRLTVGIRPEHLALDPVSGTALPVELVEELGNGLLVHLRLGETLLSLTLPETDRRPVGAFLPVTLPAEAVHLFDADTGVALTFGAATRPAALAHA